MVEKFLRAVSAVHAAIEGRKSPLPPQKRRLSPLKTSVKGGTLISNSHRLRGGATQTPPSKREARGFAVLPCFVVKQVRREIASAAEGGKGEGCCGCLFVLSSGEREAVFCIFLPRGGVSVVEKFLRAVSAVHAAIEGRLSPLSLTRHPPLKTSVKGGTLISNSHRLRGSAAQTLLGGTKVECRLRYFARGARAPHRRKSIASKTFSSCRTQIAAEMAIS